MRNYRASAGSQIRVDYGLALVRGLLNFDKTRPQGVAFKSLNDELDVQYQARLALRKPWIEARQDVRFCDYNADQVIRAFQRATEIADRGRRGTLSKALFPEGVSPVVGPAGAAQLPALDSLIDRFKKSRVEGIDAHRAAELPKLEAAQAQLSTAVEAYKTARKAYLDAFGTERAIRDEHRLAVTALMGAVTQAFPGDKALQDIIFPDSSVTNGLDADDDADTDPAPAPAPADS